MRSLQFACLVVAFSIAAAYQIISGKTMSAASPEGAAEVEVGSALSSNFVTSALPVPHGPLLLPKEETSSSTLEKEQARLEAAFDALEQQARTEDSVQDHSADAAPPKRNFLYLAYYAFSEIPPDEKPADTILETMKGLPIGTPVEEIRRASDAFGLDFNFMKAVAEIESASIRSNILDLILGYSSSVIMSSNNTAQETLPIRATMPLPALTNLPRRLYSLSSGPAESRLSVICI